MPLPDPAPVLVVDDDELIRGILRNRLERLGVLVVTAASAEDALAAMEVMRVGVLVLDLQMPGRSGLDLAEFVRLFGAHLQRVPILIFTGTSPPPQTLDQARRLGAEVYAKPGDLQRLLERIVVLADPVNQLMRADHAGSGQELADPRDPAASDRGDPES